MIFEVTFEHSEKPFANIDKFSRTQAHDIEQIILNAINTAMQELSQREFNEHPVQCKGKMLIYVGDDSIKSMHAGEQFSTEEGKEKLYAEFSKDFTVFLERVGGPPFEGSEPPFVNIHKPGYYVLDYQRTVRPPFDELKEAWKRLSHKEREGFIAGLEASMIPAQCSDSEDFCF